MPKTTSPDVDQPTIPPPPRPPSQQERVERLADEIEARWDQQEKDRKRERARAAARTQLEEEARDRRLDDIPYWRGRLARYGLIPVKSFWPDCPVERSSRSGESPGKPFGGGELRPVAIDGLCWWIDDQGIHRRDDYWVSSPVFWVRAGTNPSDDRYAVLNKGTWVTVKVDYPPPPEPSRNGNVVFNPGLPPRDWTKVIKALKGAGLQLNPEPVLLDFDNRKIGSPADLELAKGERGEVRTVSAATELVRFLEQHLTEPPVR